MNKHLVTVIALAAFAGLSFASCSKPGSSTSTKDMIVAQWTLARQATDTNNNGKADPNEWSTATSSGLTLATVNFKADGTGSERYVITGVIDTTQPFTWSLNSTSTYVTLTFGGTASYMHIDTLNAHVFTLKDTSGGQANWTTLIK